MRIVVANTAAPFIRGGAELLADMLVAHLRMAGHAAELVTIPLRWDDPQAVRESMLAASLLRVDGAERVVALKFPAYFVRHPVKVVWLLHQYRQVYDLWGTPYGQSPTPDAELLKAEIRDADTACLASCHAVFTNSRTTSERLRTHNGLAGRVLLPPLENAEQFHPAGYGDYIFAGGRVTAGKRQHLLVEAMRHVHSRVRLTIAGPADHPSDADRIKAAITAFGVEERVRYLDGFLPEAEKVHLVNGCLAAAYMPIDEDSFGYVSLEACLASKPVVTATDAGGILELVSDGESGRVVPPHAQRIAEAFDELFDDRTRARRMGDNARARAESLDLSWARVVEQLTA